MPDFGFLIPSKRDINPSKTRREKERGAKTVGERD